MRKIHILFVAFFAFALFENQSFAQFAMTSGSTLSSQGWNADSLVQNVLVGQGVRIRNARLNGSTLINYSGLGTFTTGNNSTGLGFGEGLILSTAEVTTATGGNGSACVGSYTGTTPLSGLTTLTLNNVCVLEFEFYPMSDSIKFEYVFASDEYPEYVCSQFNDVFGFFIVEGVAPSTATLYDNTNIALIPNTNTMISVSTVNGGSVGSNGTASNDPCILSHSAYYVNRPSHSAPASVNFDGHTTVLTAEASVYPCTWYKLKMCIANASDQALQSAVYLRANSLTSNGITARFVNAANPEHQDQLYEGCVAQLILSRPKAKATPTLVNVSFLNDGQPGYATNGQDFSQWNPTITFPAGDTSITFDIAPDYDQVLEGSEQVVMVLEPEDGCADTITFSILDTDPLVMNAVRSDLDANSTQATMYVEVEGGMPNRQTTWTNLQSRQVRVGDTIVVNTVPRENRYMSPEQLPQALYRVLVHDSCQHMTEDTLFVGILRKFAHPTFFDTIICQGQPLDMVVNFADSCVWRQGSLTANPVMTGPTTLSITANNTTRYVVSSYAYWADQWWEDIDTIEVNVVPSPTITLSADHPMICPGESVKITASGVDSCSWDGGITYVHNTSHSYTLMDDSTFTIYGKTRAAGCPAVNTIDIQVDFVPTITLSDGGGICGGEDVRLSVETDGNNFVWSSNPTDPSLAGQTTNNTILVNPEVTTEYILTAYSTVCSSRDSRTVAVEPAPEARAWVDPATVSLGNMEASFHDVSLNTSSRLWVFPDGTTREDQDFSYVLADELDSLRLMLVAYNPYMCTDTTHVTVYVDHSTLWAPNAFTPDESTNRTFLVKMNDIADYRIWIYNRAGQLVFHSTNPEEPWDGNNQNGQKCPEGAYVYFISAHKTVTPFTQMTYSGTVVIIR